ncbi:tripartite tricarboxylate transporter permease [Candidatus Micrarchaeota archaeon]|nr:tripartite tricarboxylate transporter permease [Candidatus Micrarchaeota archaeon]
MIWIVIFLLGVLVGLVGALIPGIHSNTIISIGNSLGIENFEFFILAVFGAHMVASYVPAIFFGIPEQNSVLASLPGHRMTLSGKGLTALKIVLFSLIISLLLSVGLFYPSMSVFPFVYDGIKEWMPEMLILISAVLILKSKKPIVGGVLFLIAGVLGYFTLRADLGDPFLPLFSGMFAINSILNYSNSKIPEQKEKELNLDFIPYILVGTVFGFFADLFPGIGSASQIAAFISLLIPFNTAGYLATVSSVTMSEAVFSFATAASIGKSRMGATAVLSESIKIQENLGFVLALFMVSVLIAVIAVYLIRRKIVEFAKIDFSEMRVLLALYLCGISFLVDGFIGLLVLGVASLLGWIFSKLEIEKTLMMGAVIVPTILLLLRVW